MHMRKSIAEASRRDILRAGLSGVAITATGGVATLPAWAQVAAARSDNPQRILVIVELSGGNDGLNTIVPYGDDVYYRERPKLGIRKDRLRRIDDHFGMQFTMSGFERLYKDGSLAIVHGVGYDKPSLSHFASMAFWHTAAPNSGEQFGWAGKLADAIDPGERDNMIVNVERE